MEQHVSHALYPLVVTEGRDWRKLYPSTTGCCGVPMPYLLAICHTALCG